MDSLNKKVVIVTGAGHGVGAHIATALAEKGCSVCVADINPDRVEKVVSQIVDSGGTAFGWHCDVSNKFQVASTIEATRDRYTNLDIFINTANANPTVSALKMDEWALRRVVEVNFVGNFLCAQLAARVMADERGGDIIFVQRKVFPETSGGMAAYFGTFQGVQALSEALSVELEGDKIRIHTLAYTEPSDLIAELFTTLNGQGQDNE